ncbi:MAG TPA: hypothetical protein VGU02_02270 [Gaiellaceae bacterium]|nr:hypothetical protein [Gaiellaceae bacterium]
MLWLVVLGIPFAIAAAASSLSRRWRLVIAAGLVPVAALFAWAYLGAPHQYDPAEGCSDCGEYLGRWWEPDLVAFFAICGYTAWLAGVGAGRLLRLVR